MAKHRNPEYTEEFRKEAVRLASLPGRTAVSVAKELGNEGMQNEQFYEIWFLDLTFKTTLQNVIFGKKGKLPHKTLVTGKRGVLNCFEPVSYELTSKQIKAFKSNNKHTYIVITNPRGKIFAISRKAKRKGLLL